MTYLELLQDAARKCGIGIPTTTVSQTGESLRLLEYVDAAWLETQGLRKNWNWMWVRGTFVTVASQRDYTLASISLTALNWIAPYSASIYETGDTSTESRISVDPYMDYRSRHDIGTQTEGRPVRLIVMPDRSLRLHPTPDDEGYTVEFDYYSKPTSLSGDSDEPEIPNADLHPIITWRAVTQYAIYEEAPELFSFATAEYGRYLARLRSEERPEPAIRVISA